MADDLTTMDEAGAHAALADADARLLVAPEWSDAARVQIDRKMAVHRRLAQLRAEQDRAKVAGVYRVRQPEPAEAPPEPEAPMFDLPPDFAGHESAIVHAQAVAEREGFDHLPSLLTMLANTPPHERTPPGLDAAAQSQQAEAAQAAIRAKHGDEEGQRIIDGAVAAVRALGLRGVVRSLGQTDHVDIIEHLGQRWLARRAARMGA
jgi:hypothetical protein